MITFAPDPLTTQRPTCTETRWPSTDGRWAILEIRSDYGRRRRRDAVQLLVDY